MDRLSLIKSPVNKELDLFKAIYDESLASSNFLLKEIITHLKQRDGKIMRPTLTLLIASIFGEINDVTLQAAVSLELLHTASLVHDDVVDESDQRRGQPSVNAAFNNKVAVLGGDYLLATCLLVAGRTENPAIIDLITKLGQDLSEGELLQLSNLNNQNFSEDVYYDIIRMKTAALFSTCTGVGALSVKADENHFNWARLFGEYLGISFQIKDDIFDYYDNRVIGKPTGNDMLEGKLTLPVLYVLNNTSDEWVIDVALRVRKNIATIDEIGRLIEFTKNNGGIEYATEKMYEFQSRAVKLLDQISDSVYKQSLTSFAEHVVERDK